MNPITKEEFEAYEKVRSSGRTNMMDTKRVQRLSGLAIKKIFAIAKKYSDLEEIYPGVRK